MECDPKHCTFGNRVWRADLEEIARLRAGINNVISDMENGWEGRPMIDALRKLVVNEQNAPTVEDQVARDMRNYGVGIYKRNSDGTIEYVNPGDVLRPKEDT